MSQPVPVQNSPGHAVRDAAPHDLLERLTSSVRTTDNLTPAEMWLSADTPVWQSRHGINPDPWFYPVYRNKDLYSTSPLALMLLKGHVRVNPRTRAAVSVPGFRHCPSDSFVDSDITRIGGPLRFRRRIRSESDFASRIALAMQMDVEQAEQANPENVNFVLCGGRDSLNLLLLPWKNRTIAASGAPNTELVREFISRNDLPYDLVTLKDGDNSLLQHEVLANCCRNNLEHCRWSAHLFQISEEHGRRVTFWKGQAADVLLSESWIRYRNYAPAVRPEALCRFYRNVLKSPLQWKLSALSDRGGWSQRRFFSAVWSRAAMWQGAHLSMLRDLTAGVVLSGYQGPEMTKVLSQVDQWRAVRQDIRPLIGRILLGREVWYPESNPSPEICARPTGSSGVEAFLSQLSAAGVSVV